MTASRYSGPLPILSNSQELDFPLWNLDFSMAPIVSPQPLASPTSLMVRPLVFLTPTMHIMATASVPEFDSPTYPYPSLKLPHDGWSNICHPLGLAARARMVSQVHPGPAVGQQSSAFARDCHMAITSGVRTSAGASPVDMALPFSDCHSLFSLAIHDSSAGERTVGLIFP